MSKQWLHRKVTVRISRELDLIVSNRCRRDGSRESLLHYLFPPFANAARFINLLVVDVKNGNLLVGDLMMS